MLRVQTIRALAALAGLLILPGGLGLAIAVARQADSFAQLGVPVEHGRLWR